MARFRALALLLPIALGLLWHAAPPARAARSVEVSITTEDPSAGTLSPTTVAVRIGATDRQQPGPTGSVTIKDNGVVIGVAQPGQCRGLPCWPLDHVFEAGQHSLVAYYPGDANFGAAQSAPLELDLGRLAPVIKLETNAPKSSSLDPPTISDTFGLRATATVSGFTFPYKPTKQPTGTVTFVDFYNGEKVLATVPLKEGKATFFDSFDIPNNLGNNASIRPVYNGDANYLPYTDVTQAAQFHVEAARLPRTNPPDDEDFDSDDFDDDSPSTTAKAVSAKPTEKSAATSNRKSTSAGDGEDRNDRHSGDTPAVVRSEDADGLGQLAPSRDTDQSDADRDMAIRVAPSHDSGSPVPAAVGGTSLAGAAAALAHFLRKRAAGGLIP